MIKNFDEVFEDVTRLGTKIKTDEYHSSGKYQIIDQGQEDIAGYTDLENGLFQDMPAIIFGDHTRIIKYVDKPFFLGADGVKVLRCRYDSVNYRYLYYALKNVRIPNTGYNRHFKWLKEAQIRYPSEEYQSEIVSVLDRTSAIIEYRKKQLQKLDKLVKARFVEMFGASDCNKFGYDVSSIENISEQVFAGGDKPIETAPSKTAEYLYPVFANGYERNGLQCYSKKYRVDKPSVTVSARGTIGYCFTREPFFTPIVRLITVVPKQFINVEYLKYAIDNMNLISSGSSQQQLTVPDFKKKVIVVPPIEKQYEFSNFVKQVDKSKSAIQKALDEAQLLFDSLMQKYFG